MKFVKGSADPVTSYCRPSKKGKKKEFVSDYYSVPSKPELGILHKIKPAVAKVLINSRVYKSN